MVTELHIVKVRMGAELMADVIREKSGEDNAMCEPVDETIAEVVGWRGEVGAARVNGRETILFVEDEAFVREVTCEVLRSAGYAVLTATNAKEAMRFYDEQCGDVALLLTDVVMPGESGRELARRLRRKNPRLKVLFVTGYADQMGLRGTGSEECLAKPFSTATLLRKVRQLLDRSDFRNETKCPFMPACDNGSPAGSDPEFEAEAVLG
jgi:CheY-like chemotaxis protein